MTINRVGGRRPVSQFGWRRAVLFAFFVSLGALLLTSTERRRPNRPQTTNDGAASIPQSREPTKRDVGFNESYARGVIDQTSLEWRWSGAQCERPLARWKAYCTRGLGASCTASCASFRSGAFPTEALPRRQALLRAAKRATVLAGDTKWCGLRSIAVALRGNLVRWRSRRRSSDETRFVKMAVVDPQGRDECATMDAVVNNVIAAVYAAFRRSPPKRVEGHRPPEETPVVSFVGDEVTRQLFVTLISICRGLPSIVDLDPTASAMRYTLTTFGDQLSVSPNVFIMPRRPTMAPGEEVVLDLTFRAMSFPGKFPGGQHVGASYDEEPWALFVGTNFDTLGVVDDGKGLYRSVYDHFFTVASADLLMARQHNWLRWYTITPPLQRLPLPDVEEIRYRNKAIGAMVLQARAEELANATAATDALLHLFDLSALDAAMDASENVAGGALDTPDGGDESPYYGCTLRRLPSSWGRCDGVHGKLQVVMLLHSFLESAASAAPTLPKE